jgi:ABC-type uncharacterized transport system substrate-binding protein
LPALAAEIVAARPAVIATIGGVGVARAAQAATSTVPIVFEVGVDPVAAGLVGSLARPGANSTGVYMLTGSLNEKRVQYLHEMVPRATTVALLLNPRGPVEIEGKVREATDSRGLRLVVVSAGSEQGIDSALRDAAASGAGALVVANSPFFNSRREQLATTTLRLGIPAIFEWREFAVAGGLMSYRQRHLGRASPTRRLRRPHPERRTPRRAADRPARTVRAGHQPPHRGPPRPDHPAKPAAARRSHRMRWSFPYSRAQQREGAR